LVRFGLEFQQDADTAKGTLVIPARRRSEELATELDLDVLARVSRNRRQADDAASVVDHDPVLIDNFDTIDEHLNGAADDVLLAEAELNDRVSGRAAGDCEVSGVNREGTVFAVQQTRDTRCVAFR